MAGVDITYDLSELEAIAKRFRLAVRSFGMREALEVAGAVGESAAKERIQKTRKSPSGNAWQAWSAQYAKTRHAGQSLLSGEGSLHDSLAWQVEGDKVKIGSPLQYAAIHQLGGRAGRNRTAKIPARPYLGFSKKNLQTLTHALVRALEGAFNG